jgi:hypothetical protein
MYGIHVVYELFRDKANCRLAQEARRILDSLLEKNAFLDSPKNVA